MNGALAVLFSLMAPGAGQAYNGQFVKAGIIIFFFALGKSFVLPLMLRFFARGRERRGLKIIFGFNIFYILFVVGAIIDAYAFSSSKNSSFILCFVLVLCARAVQINTLNENIFFMLCGNINYFSFVAPKRARAASPSEKIKNN